MATTKSGFMKFSSGGTTHLVACPAAGIPNVTTAFTATRLDLVAVNLSSASYAKNGAVRLTLVGTTPQDISLVDTTITGANAGDTVFASFSQLILVNDGAASVTVIPGASNGASLPFASLTVAAGASHVLTYTTPVTVDSSHKIATVTPSAGGSFVLLIGGA